MANTENVFFILSICYFVTMSKILDTLSFPVP